MTKFSNKILKKPIFAPFSTFLGQFFFKSSSVTHNTTWASNTMKKIVFSEKTNEAIPKKLPDGQVQTHRTLPFQKKPGVQKGIKIWTYTHARPQTYKHAWTHREREREPHLEIFELIKYYLVRFTLFLNGPPITFAVFIVILFPWPNFP